jgi:hypothetical protein
VEGGAGGRRERGRSKLQSDRQAGPLQHLTNRVLLRTRREKAVAAGATAYCFGDGAIELKRALIATNFCRARLIN